MKLERRNLPMSPSDLDERALSAARAARASVRPVEEAVLNRGADPLWGSLSRRGHRHTRKRIAALVVAALLVVAGFAVTAELHSDERTKVSTAPAGQPSVNYPAFCRQAPKPGDDKGQAYVGSEQHVADLDALVTAAPGAVHDDLVRLRNYVKANVKPTRPESQSAENWPSDVRSSADRVKQFIADNCGSGAGPDCIAAAGASICLPRGSGALTASGLEPGSPVVMTLVGPNVDAGHALPPMVAGPDGRFPSQGVSAGLIVPPGSGAVTETVTVTPRGGTPTMVTFRR